MLMLREQKALRGQGGTVSKCRLKEEEAMSILWVAFQQSKLFIFSKFICATNCTARGLCSDKTKKNRLGVKTCEQNQTMTLASGSDHSAHWWDLWVGYLKL